MKDRVNMPDLDRIPLQVIIDHYRELTQRTPCPITVALLREIEDYLWEYHRL